MTEMEKLNFTEELNRITEMYKAHPCWNYVKEFAKNDVPAIAAMYAIDTAKEVNASLQAENAELKAELKAANNAAGHNGYEAQKLKAELEHCREDVTLLKEINAIDTDYKNRLQEQLDTLKAELEAVSVNADKWLKLCELLGAIPDNKAEHIHMDIVGNYNFIQVFCDKYKKELDAANLALAQAKNLADLAREHTFILILDEKGIAQDVRIDNQNLVHLTALFELIENLPTNPEAEAILEVVEAAKIHQTGIQGWGNGGYEGHREGCVVCKAVEKLQALKGAADGVF